MNKIIAAIGVLVVLVLGGYVVWSSSHTLATSDKLQVAASFYPLYFFASQIGGGKVDVLNITPADAEPHDYEPTAQDIARIENAQVLVLNGTFRPGGARIKQI